MAINMSNITDAANIYEMTKGVTQIEPMFAPVILLVVFVVMFMAMKRYGTVEALLADSFICTVVGILMWVMGWMGWHILMGPMLLLFVMIFIRIFSE